MRRYCLRCPLHPCTQCVFVGLFVVYQVIWALYDDDLMTNRAPGDYGARAYALLSSWLCYSGSVHGNFSIFTHMGVRDRGVVLCLTGSNHDCSACMRVYIRAAIGHRLPVVSSGLLLSLMRVIHAHVQTPV